MAENKTKQNDNSVEEFIESVESDKKRQDAYRLLEIFETETGYEAKMWGPSIIGFGSYHYVYDSGHEGDAPLVGFSPRKANISLYLDYEGEDRDRFLSQLGKHKTGKACTYINKFADIDETVLREFVQFSLEKAKRQWPDHQ